MSETNNVKDYSSIYNIKDTYITKVAPNYFPIEEVSLQNTGPLGMITDISATSVEDTMRVVSRYITELLPGQSKLPQFIYANAANYNISNIFTICATCPIVIFIKEDDVIKNGTKRERFTEYIIDCDAEIFIDNIPFSIPYNIIIQSSKINETYHHTCIYDLSTSNTVANINSPYIQCVKTKMVGDSSSSIYLALNINAYQYYKTKKTEPIITNNKLNIPYVDIDFKDNLCNFEVFYKEANSEKQKQLLKYMQTVPATVQPFCYYDMINESKFRLSFTNDDRYFIPSYNSELEIITYQTLGSKGNFPQYNGNNIFISGKSDKEAFDYNNSVALYCGMYGDSINGSDAPTLEELNILTWQSSTTLNSYTTDEDLNKMFLAYKKNNKIDSDAFFIKARDDFATRLYTCNTKLKYNDNIIPTNTLPLHVTFNKIPEKFDKEKNQYFIKPGIRIGYLDDSNACILDDETPSREIEYTTIALMRFTLEPNSIEYYMNSINKNIPIQYDTVNNNAMYQFIIKSFHIKRNAIQGEHSYRITLNIIPSDITLLDNANLGIAGEDSDDMEDITSLSSTEEEDDNLNIDNASIYLYFEVNHGYYKELKYDEINTTKSGFVFYTDIETSDNISDDTIELNNLINCDTGQISDCNVPMNNPPMKIIIFYKEKAPISHFYMNKIPNTKEYSLTNVFIPEEDSLYFAYPMNAIRSYIKFIPSEEDEIGFYIMISDVVLISRNYLINNPENITLCIDRLTKQHNFLRNMCQQHITSQYAICLKLYNTYGKSKTFTITDGSLLNHVNCDISFDIRFKSEIEENSYIPLIKKTIKEYIENMNFITNSNTNKFHVSELITQLHNKYESIIEYIIFKNINGYPTDIQTIVMTTDLYSNKYAIPEYLTIDIENIRIVSV